MTPIQSSAAAGDPHHLASLTDDEIDALASADPEDLPLSEADIERLPRTPRVTMIRRALGLTQAEFGARYHLPLVHLINCEHGRDVPDEIPGAYLFLIASDPATVDRAFEQSQ